MTKSLPLCINAACMLPLPLLLILCQDVETPQVTYGTLHMNIAGHTLRSLDLLTYVKKYKLVIKISLISSYYLCAIFYNHP